MEIGEFSRFKLQFSGECIRAKIPGENAHDQRRSPAPVRYRRALGHTDARC